MQVLHKIPVFLRCRNCSSNCLLSKFTAVGKFMDMHVFTPFSTVLLWSFSKSTKKERKHSFLAPHHFLCFLVFILFPAFLLVYNQSKVVLVFPPSASLNIKKHQKTILCFLMSFLSFQANAWTNITEARTDFFGAFRTICFQIPDHFEMKFLIQDIPRMKLFTHLSWH